MMRWIVSTSIRFRFLVVALGGAMMLFGVTQLRDMPVDVFPEFAPPKVEIQTVTLGLTPEETETLVTVPLEQALAGIPALDVLRSKSVGQLSQIELIFDPGTDLIRSRQLVQERLQSVAPNLPTWAAPPIMLQPLSSTSRVMKIGISSKDVSVIDQSMTAYWKIRARLLRVPGVANAVIWGERIDMKVVQVAPQLLEAKGITLDEVMESTGDALDAGILKYTSGSVVGKGGFIDTANQRLNVHHVLPVLEPAELAEVVVAKRGGESIRIGDVARVVKDHQALIGDAVIDGGPGLMMIVEKLPWGNTLDVTQGVEDAIDQMRPGLPGFDIDTTIFRPATFVQEALNNLGESLVLGSVLVVIVLALFLFDWRSALDQRHHHPDVADRGRAGALRPRRHDQHDGAGGLRDRARRHRRRRHRRRREHRATAPPGRRAGERAVEGVDHPGVVARGPGRRRVRVVHRGAGPPAGLLPRGSDRRVLPSAGLLLRPGRARLAGGRADPDARPCR